MHVLLFCEQHPHTLGGAQASTLLQAEFLERAGHTVTFVSPALRSGPLNDPRYIDLPSHPIPSVAAYTWLWPRAAHLDMIATALRDRPPVDVVHVQSDFWGAALGFRWARDHARPVVYTLHNRLDVGITTAFPFPRLLLAVLDRWQRWALGHEYRRVDRSAFGFLGGFAHHATTVIAPSRHFARLLTSNDVVSRANPEIVVIPTGVNDDLIDELSARRVAPRTVPLVAWVGRFSPEKRLLEFLEAVAESDARFDVVVVGDGALAAEAKRIASDNVRFLGALPYREAVGVIADADFLVQSSSGFETQGMTVTEAVALGTHVVIADSDIAGDLPAGSFTLASDDSVDALRDAVEEAIEMVRERRTRSSSDQSTSFRQSVQTSRMIEVYRHAARR